MKKQKDARLRSTGRKVAAAILVFLFSVIAVGGGISAGYMILEEIYFTPQEEYREQQLNSQAVGAASMALSCWLVNPSDQVNGELDRMFAQSNVVGITIETTEENRMQWGTTSEGMSCRSFFEYGKDKHGPFQSPLYGTKEQMESPNPQWVTPNQVATVNVYLRQVFTEKDDFYWQDMLIRAAYAFRYWVYVITAAALAGAIWCFVFLMRSAGLRKNAEGVQSWPVTRIPGDLLYGFSGLVLFLLIQLVYEGTCYGGGMKYLILGIPVIFYLLLFLCMELSVRCKVGGFWKHTAIYWIGIRLMRGIQKVGRFCKELFRNLPLIWKTGLAYIAVSLLNLILIRFNYGELDNLIVIWCVENLVLLPVVLVSALMMRKLLKAGKALAEGDMTAQVDTSRMILDFKAHGENLNHIGEGMTVAVEQRMKSERMKTALITNVSHDIKTPLTSIINYSDLICKETCENGQITQYAQVLYRQSEKLKRLIEDLVEASKASTGNIEINLAPCEVGVILTQAVGEYEEKLSQANLELITKKPDTPVKIMADSRRLWRIFDNLMINISKYAQPGTRVYLTLEEDNNHAKISFKNISKAVLDISPDELMERFVQGDRSRSSEGNGLGLSITKSLTELQGGTMGISIDGDLFKVVLCFPKENTQNQD